MSDETATKSDIEDLAVIIKDMGNMISAQITDLQTSNNRIENKLDATVDKVDDHEVRIGKLENRPA